MTRTSLWRHAVALAAVAWSLLPVAALVVVAFTPGTAAAGQPAGEVWRDLLTDPSHPYPTWFANSLLSAATAAVLVVFLGTCAAYGLSTYGLSSYYRSSSSRVPSSGGPSYRSSLGPVRRSRSRTRWRALMRDGLLVSQAFPSALAVIGLYLTVAKLGEAIPQAGRNTWLGLALCYLGMSLAWVAWLLAGSLRTLPREVLDAATLDGAGHLRIFFTFSLRHLAPVLVPMLGVLFASLYGEFMVASALLGEPDRLTLAVGVTQLADGGPELHRQFAAGALLACLPMVLIAVGCYRGLSPSMVFGPDSPIAPGEPSQRSAAHPGPA